MAVRMGGPTPPKSVSKEDIQELYDTASASVAAQTLLDAMGPQLEKAMGLRLAKLFECKPELGELLDARASLKAVWELKQGLNAQAKKGQNAVDVFNKLLVEAANK